MLVLHIWTLQTPQQFYYQLLNTPFSSLHKQANNLKKFSLHLFEVLSRFSSHYCLYYPLTSPLLLVCHSLTVIAFLSLTKIVPLHTTQFSYCTTVWQLLFLLEFRVTYHIVEYFQEISHLLSAQYAVFDMYNDVHSWYEYLSSSNAFNMFRFPRLHIHIFYHEILQMELKQKNSSLEMRFNVILYELI